jgi:2-oxoglutarate ferredoxin oxidoreductase subunit gamma
MKEKLLIAGFGGQGVLLAGVVLANSGMMEGSEVSWMPSYGPEMRGGTANCHVTISDKPIGSPIVEVPDSVILMNRPSVDKFEGKLKTDGVMIVNSSLAGKCISRKDVRLYLVPANDIALELGNNKIANIVMLGAYIQVTGVVEGKTVEEAIKNVIGQKKAELIELNILALKRGMGFIGGINGNQGN